MQLVIYNIKLNSVSIVTIYFYSKINKNLAYTLIHVKNENNILSLSYANCQCY